MIKQIVLNLIRFYQLFSRLGLPKCRFYPSCSEYSFEAVEKYGIFKGVFLGSKRLLRCHPFSKGGYDPVP